MHILIDAHPITDKPTGIGRYCSNLITHLQNILPNGSRISLYQHKGQEHIFPNMSKYISPVKNGLYRSTIGFDQAIKKLKPDILHSTTLGPFLKTIPQIITVHDVCFHTNPRKYSLKTLLAFKLLFRKSISRADAIICPSKNVKQNLISYFNISPHKIHTTYEAPDEIFNTTPKKHQINHTLNELKIDKPFFLVVGDMHKRKGSSDIVQVFDEFNVTYPQSQIVFVGPKKSVSKNKNIIYTGYLSNERLSHLYQSAEALIFNSICEGFGLPLVEAFTSKTPTICSNIPTFKEISSDSSLFFDNNQELLTNLEKVYKNQKLKNKLTNRGYQALNRYSWKITAKQTLMVYQQVLS